MTLSVALCGTPLSSRPTLAAEAAAEQTVSVTLNETQAKAIKVEVLGERLFTLEKDAVGTVDFNQDLSVPVYPPYPGKIIEARLSIGDRVKQGQTLYSISSPDLVQAEATLITAAATYTLTTHALARAKEVFAAQGLSEKDLEQAVSDQQTAEGALRAARDAVALFGKSGDEIDHIIAQRRVDPAMLVPSPISGEVTARAAQPGLFVQPGTAPAPYSVADLAGLWLLANVAESDSPALRVGQAIKVSVMALPNHSFDAEITRISPTVDPAVHTVTARSEIKDPDHLLRPGMIASFKIKVGAPERAVALPASGLVREGDGTLTAWVTTDRRKFTQRTVKTGLQQGNFWQILEGLKPGEQAVADNAILLDNIASGGVTD